MASVKRWIFAAALGCLATALAYAPPRGARSSRRDVFAVQWPRGTPARQHAQAVADEWRAADATARLLSARRQLQDVVRAASSRGNSLVVVSESAGVAITTPPLADSALRIGWRELGLGETKVNVAVVLQMSPFAVTRDRPVADAALASYLAPDSTDRTTCIAVVSLGRYWSRAFARDARVRVQIRFDAHVQSLKTSLGPCAFYAAYGTPSRSVRAWLAAHEWDLAARLDPGPRGVDNSLVATADPRYSWYWDAIYSLPPQAVGCLAGRAAQCRAAVLSGTSDEPATPVPDVLRIDRSWGRVPRVVGAPRFLGDVAHEVGRERFLAFWTSPLPVDTALAAALERPVGDWTAEWQRQFTRPIRLGPVAPVGASGIAFAIAALALMAVARVASRRQVR